MNAPSAASTLLAERAAGRASDAAQDVVVLLAQGRVAEAIHCLAEARRHIVSAQALLEKSDG